MLVDTVCVLSAGRSGSTLLTLMIGGHPTAFAAGEITHLPKNLVLNTICQCGHSVRACDFWARVLADLPAGVADDPYKFEMGFINASSVIDRDKATVAYKLKWRLMHAAYVAGELMGHQIVPPLFLRGIENTRTLFDSIRRHSDTRVVIDSSKSYIKSLGMYKAAPQGTRFLVLVRDGRGVMWSNIKKGMKPNEALSVWTTYYRRMLRLLRDVPDEHVSRVQYEELTQNPEAEMRRISGFLQLDYHEGMLRLDSKIHHVTNGNNMRFRDGLVRGTDRSWSDMPKDLMTYFDRHGAALNEQLMSDHWRQPSNVVGQAVGKERLPLDR